MPLEQHEYFQLIARICDGLAEASTPDSSGGVKISTSEWIQVAIDAGVKLAEDIVDDDYPEPEAE